MHEGNARREDIDEGNEEKSKLRNELESINNVRETYEKRSFQNNFELFHRAGEICSTISSCNKYFVSKLIFNFTTLIHVQNALLVVVLE